MNHATTMLTSALRMTAATLVFLCAAAGGAQAAIDGLAGANFALEAKTDYISAGDGGSLLIWGFSNGAGRAQYPGPTLILTQGATVTVALTNRLTVPVSIVFPGQENVKAECVANCAAGLLTTEAKPSGTVRYTFTASQPGTYLYHSGTNPELQVEMGLVGAIIVRPFAGPSFAYNQPDTKFDREYLFLMTEMDPRIHQMVELGNMTAALQYLEKYFPNYWFLNGRTAPDSMLDPNVPWLPAQPYNCFPRMHPGERVLLRLIGAGRDSHPFHTHGNHARVIARDGRLLESAPGAGPDLSTDVFTINSFPGETVDAIFEWTGKGLGWDIYGTATPHTCNGVSLSQANPDSPAAQVFDPVTKEWCGDHGRPFPVILPETQFLTVGPFYSGSPFMGTLGALPPGEGGLNPNGGFPYMWHSHSERELTNFNIFPGGMMTMLVIEPPGVPIP